MNRRETIKWLRAILEDTLDPEDQRDTERITAVKLAIKVVEEAEGRRRQRSCERKQG